MSGEFNGFVLLGILWLLLSLMTRGRPKGPRTPSSRSPNPPRPRPLPGAIDATQREGLRLETVLRELQRSLEEAARPAGLPPTTVARRPEDTPESLELEPEVTSLETEVRREVRRAVDLDDEAAEIEARRIEAAEARDKAGVRQRPVVIQPDIQAAPADHTAVRGYSPQQLRDAIVWREILGPPVSER